MEPTIPWYQSAIVRQQIVMIIVGIVGVLGVATDIDIDATVGAIFAAIAAIVPVWTLITRMVKPTPPITETAAAKTAEMRETAAVKAETALRDKQ